MELPIEKLLSPDVVQSFMDTPSVAEVGALFFFVSRVLVSGRL